jgi:DNA-directed RNA polymerase subunit M/transcription elongation factor TFIIS
MEARKCPDCNRLVYASVEKIEGEGEAMVCEQCGYVFYCLEDEEIRKYHQHIENLKIINE